MLVTQDTKQVLSKAGGGYTTTYIKGTIPTGSKLIVELYPCLAQQSWIETTTLTDASTFQLSLYPVRAIEHVFVNGILVEDYEIDSWNGVITFDTPQTGNLKVYYTAFPEVDSEPFETKEIIGSGVEVRKTMVWNTTGLGSVLFAFSTDGSTSFYVEVI